MDKVRMHPTELLNCWYHISSLISLSRQPCSEQSSSSDKILILRAGSSITDKLWKINIVCWCRSNIAAQKWKFIYGKVEVIPLNWSLVVSIPLLRLSSQIFYNFKFTWEDDFEVLWKLNYSEKCICLQDWHVWRGVYVLLSFGLNIGLVKTYETHYHIFWITFTLDLALSYTDNLWKFRWVLIVLLLRETFVLFSCKRDFMKSRSDDTQADIIEAFNSTSRYLHDLLNKA